MKESHRETVGHLQKFLIRILYTLIGIAPDYGKYHKSYDKQRHSLVCNPHNNNYCHRCNRRGLCNIYHRLHKIIRKGRSVCDPCKEKSQQDTAQISCENPQHRGCGDNPEIPCNKQFAYSLCSAQRGWNNNIHPHGHINYLPYSYPEGKHPNGYEYSFYNLLGRLSFFLRLLISQRSCSRSQHWGGYLL